jgi:hypothetical protein
VAELEPPAGALMTAVLADETVEPSLEASGKIEVGGSMVSTKASSSTAW